MKVEFRRQKPKVRSRHFKVRRRKFLLFCLLSSVFCLLSCSIPNLEKPECTEARQTLKEFYSFHFGGDMKFTKENLHLRKKFLSDQLLQKLEARPDDSNDFFTATDNYPKTFRVGVCQVTEPKKKVDAQVLLFWRKDEKNEQKEIKAEVIKENEKWLISDISQP